MTDASIPWLTVDRGLAPLIISLPHTGTEIPAVIEADVVSSWLARKDCDWWIDRVYGFANTFDATGIRTAISRTVIDVNRDPSGVSLYPGQATTDLVPTTSFDGEPLWRHGRTPDAAEIGRRRATYYDPYHRAIAREIERLRNRYDRIVLYDCHSIRSVIPRLFVGELPVFNIGTVDGTSCAPALQSRIAAVCHASSFSTVTNGRFKGGHITRRYGRPADGVHAVQMEIACRGYMREPPGPVAEGQWPVPYNADFATPMRAIMRRVVKACVDFAQGG